MEIQEEFRKLFELSTAHKVEYLITNKRSLGSKKDLADLEGLEQDG